MGKTTELPKKISVLLIDDSLEDQELIFQTLSKPGSVGFNLTHAHSLKTGIKQLHSEKPDVILVDPILPDSSGTSTLTKLKQFSKGTPIIIITTQADVSFALESTRQGADSFILKSEISSDFLQRNILLVYEKDRFQKLYKDEQQKYIQAAKFSLLGEMSAGIAHEIANPLSVILSRAKLTARKYRDDEYLNETFLKIENMVGRITSIMGTMKSFARNATEDEMSLTPLSTIMKDALELSQEKIRSHGINILAPDFSGAFVYGRGIELSQVFLNLISNSADAIKDLEERWIEISIEYAQDCFKVHVTDSGSGIPDELKQQIMEPFFTTKGIGKGTGIGLSISKSIMESHQGSLTINSENKNTQFVVTLPLAGSAQRKNQA